MEQSCFLGLRWQWLPCSFPCMVASDAASNDSEVPSSDPISRRANPYATAIISFWETMEALRDLANSLGPVVQDLDGFDRIGKEVAEYLPSGEREQFLENWSSSRSEQTKEISAPEVPEVAEVAAVAEGPEVAEISEVAAVAEVRLEDLVTLAEETDDPVVRNAVMAVLRLARRAPRSFFIYQSLLAMAVGSFEVLLGGVWSSFFRDRPSMLDDQERRFSLSDLTQFETLDDAIELAIEKRVDSLLLSSFEQWADWFRDHKVTEFKDSALSWLTIREIVQRRHVVVHNGGRVSRRYLEQLADLSDLPEVGTILWTDEKYLHSALDELTVLGVLVAGSAWSKARKDDRKAIAAFLLGQIDYPLMLAGRWGAVSHLSKQVRIVSEEGYTHLALQCNEWHARKMLSGIDDIRAEVEAWDTSALADVFVLVKHCLLEDLDAAFAVVDNALASGGLETEDISKWPILAPLRDDPRYLLIAGGTKSSSSVEEE